jgi:hypothetical protein
MRNLGAIVLAVAVAVTGQSSSSRQDTKQPHTEPTTSTPNVLPTKGQIEKGTYKNPSIGLEFTPADNLHLQEPEMRGTPGTTPLIITVEARSEGGLVSSLISIRSLTTFYADALAYYPEEQRNATSYLKKIILANESVEFQHVDGKTSEQISGIQFLRADFVKEDVHEAVLVVTRHAYAFVFIFAGSDVEATNKLIAATDVKFTQ